MFVYKLNYNIETLRIIYQDPQKIKIFFNYLYFLELLNELLFYLTDWSLTIHSIELSSKE